MKELKLKYKTPAEDNLIGWEKYSLPIGNGHFGASVFGGAVDKIQITTNEFANDFSRGGVSSFAEIFVGKERRFEKYERGLRLLDGVAYSRFTVNDNIFSRQAFVSYPDDALVYDIKSEKPDDFFVELCIPYLTARSVEDGGREGKVLFENDLLIMEGKLPSRDLLFYGSLLITTDGKKTYKDGKIFIENATETTIVFVFQTNYVLCTETFRTHKALGENPHNACLQKVLNVKSKSFDELYETHKLDYTTLAQRVEFDLGGREDDRSTEELLYSYKSGNREPYLEEIYYVYARHLLISSSRKNTLPASLQGVWSAHDKSPWGSGFWHNINIQMNYWLAFSMDLAETFDAYVAFNKAYMPVAQENAKEWISRTNPENYSENCGWIIGTGAFAYEVEGVNENTHSGPGTGALTTKLFFDYYDFTRDENILKNVTYPVVHGTSEFLTKCVKEYDGKFLVSFSASPEQILSGWWVNEHEQQQYIHTVGCSFDQQMLYENAKDDLLCSEILGTFDKTTEQLKKQISGYDPIRIGYSGQIKEYEEEHFYGEIGEAKHRHLSQLVALMPGTIVNSTTPAWLDSAKITLNLRGDKSTGWALAHRLCSWARVGDGNHAYKLLQTLLSEKTYPNLWDVHPPFQIDGNFGAGAGMTEMLLQSHEGFIRLFPAIPTVWKNIHVKGLKARGNFTVSFDYRKGIFRAEIISNKGMPLTVKAEGCKRMEVTTLDGKNVAVERNGEFVSFATKIGETYLLTGKINQKKTEISDFIAEYTQDGVSLSWKNNCKEYAVLRAKDSESDYTVLAILSDCKYTDREFSLQNKGRLTYKVVETDEGTVNKNATGAVAVLSPASKVEYERYLYRLKYNNMTIKELK